jgi:nonsense-mediated mRNA decay protein 3
MIYSNNQYYEAKLQLRPLNDEVINFVKEKIDKAENIFVSKEEKKKYGIDFYISSLQYVKVLATLLKNKFDGTLKYSTTLYGMKDGRQVYRLTVAFRMDGK